MTAIDIDVYSAIGIASFLLVFGTFFLSMYLISREKRKLMIAISLLILPLSYLDMVFDFLPSNGYRSWSHLPFMFALLIAVWERPLRERIEFEKSFKIYLVFTLTSSLLILLRIIGLYQVTFLISIGMSSLISVLVLVGLIIQIIKYKDLVIIVGVPAIFLLFVSGYFNGIGHLTLFLLLHISSYLLFFILFVFSSGILRENGKGISSYFALSDQLDRVKIDLEKSNEQYKMTFNNAKEAIIWMNEKGKVIKYNRSARRLFKPLHLKGLDLYSLFTENQNGNTNKHLKADLEKRNKIEGEYQVIIGEQKVPVLITAASNKLQDEVITQIIISDISHRKEYERTLKDYNEKILKANDDLLHSNNIKTEFISILSHDIINPLVATQGQLELMKEGLFGDLSEKQVVAIENMMKNLARINDLRRDTLDLTRLSSGKIEWDKDLIEASSLIERCTELIDKLPQAKLHRIHVDPVPGVSIRCNSNLIERAIENILSNSMRYSPEATDITINVKKTDKSVIFRFSDCGRGIPEEDLEKIFDRFYRTGDRVEGSTGLGLSIVRGIARSHKGRAWAESEGIGKGATFYLEIPINDQNWSRSLPSTTSPS